MLWNLTFIGEKEFRAAVRNMVLAYRNQSEVFDLKRFCQNRIDPIQLIFEKEVYQETWQQVIEAKISELKKNRYIVDSKDFHQNIFRRISCCDFLTSIPNDRWDAVLYKPDGFILPNGFNVHNLYVIFIPELEFIQSARQFRNIFILMQNQILHENDCACFLLETVAEDSRDMELEMTFEQDKFTDSRIRLISIDEFYKLITGDEGAFYQICKMLPTVVQDIVKTECETFVSHDSAYDELKRMADNLSIFDKESAFAMAVYLSKFSFYESFHDISPKNGDTKF